LFHSLPANNLSGHGFYQFSPELFFNLYQEKNGFELLGVWFALKAEPRYWWKVADPAAVQHRVTLRNAHEVYMLVVAKKLREVGEPAPPQQSDYAQGEWQRSGAESSTPARRSGAASALASLGLLDAARRGRERLRALRQSGLTLPAPDYERVEVDALLRRSARQSP